MLRWPHPRCGSKQPLVEVSELLFAEFSRVALQNVCFAGNKLAFQEHLGRWNKPCLSLALGEAAQASSVSPLLRAVAVVAAWNSWVAAAVDTTLRYFIIPVGASSFKDAMRIGAECYHTLKGIIKKKPLVLTLPVAVPRVFNSSLQLWDAAFTLLDALLRPGLEVMLP